MCGKVSLKMGTKEYSVSPRFISAAQLLSRWAPRFFFSAALLLFLLSSGLLLIGYKRTAALRFETPKSGSSIECKEMKSGCESAAIKAEGDK
jgi:20S proteasome alpha/beta subunit